MNRAARQHARREAIARAAWAVLMRDGVRGASVRAVLAEAQMTSGAMRYYFGNHDELLIFAAEQVLAQAGNRVRNRLADHELSGKPRVRAVLAEILPLDASRAMEVTVFARLAEVDDEAGRGSSARDSAYRGCRRLAEFAVTELAHVHGVELTTAAKELITERFHLALDGLAYQHVLNPGLLSFEDVSACLDRLIDHLADDVTLTVGERPEAH
jgi:AcrR family transcriptional regulator